MDLCKSPPPGHGILGHSHPRMRGFLEPFWKRLGVPFLPHFSDILDWTDLYICDNSSTLYEYASTGRPVLVLDAPWYRTYVNHGGRFWDWADVGVRIQDPSQLPEALSKALEDPPEVKDRRDSIVAAAYDGVALDGRATERAVAALMELVDAT